MRTPSAVALKTLDKCQQLADSVGVYKWEPHEKMFIEKIKNMSFEYLGARDQDRAREMLEVLHGSH